MGSQFESTGRMAGLARSGGRDSPLGMRQPKSDLVRLHGMLTMNLYHSSRGSLRGLLHSLAWFAMLAGLTPVGAEEFKLGDRTLKVPGGFTIERIAGPPLVDRPITAAFDEQGRLYVADSSGSNDNVQKQLAEKPHRIVRLEDTDGDGTFDKQHRLRRQDDVPRRDDVARRLALRRRRRRASGS